MKKRGYQISWHTPFKEWIFISLDSFSYTIELTSLFHPFIFVREMGDKKEA